MPKLTPKTLLECGHLMRRNGQELNFKLPEVQELATIIVRFSGAEVLD